MKVKILHICTGLAWRGGDAGMLSVVDLLRDQDNQYHHVFCPKNSAVEQKCIDRNIAYTSVKRGRKFSISYIKNIINTAKRLKVTAIHVHDSNALTMALWVMRSLKNVQLVYTRKRNNRIGTGFLKKIKYNSRHIDHILCLSNAVKAVLLPVVRDHSKIQVIYDGIDVDKYNTATDVDHVRKILNLPSEVKIVGNLAGLVPQKDIHTFIKAVKEFKGLSDMPVKFVIAGDGPMRDELVAFAKALNVENEIEFLGFRKDVPELLKGFDVFMLSSKTEGLPLVVMESFAAGTPVVSTDAGGTREAVKNGVNGFIVPVDDAQQLAEKTLKVLQDEVLAAQFSQKSAQLVHEKFTLDVMKENYKNIIGSR